jgi:hypothetical protein
MLPSGELVICDNCTLLLRAIPSRIYHHEKEDDILKVKGDRLDDCTDALRYGLYTWTTLYIVHTADFTLGRGIVGWGATLVSDDRQAPLQPGTGIPLDCTRGRLVRPHPILFKGNAMSNETLLIIVVVLLLLGGGGWYGRGRWYQRACHAEFFRCV